MTRHLYTSSNWKQYIGYCIYRHIIFFVTNGNFLDDASYERVYEVVILTLHLIHPNATYWNKIWYDLHVMKYCHGWLKYMYVCMYIKHLGSDSDCNIENLWGSMFFTCKEWRVISGLHLVLVTLHGRCTNSIEQDIQNLIGDTKYKTLCTYAAKIKQHFCWVDRLPLSMMHVVHAHNYHEFDHCINNTHELLTSDKTFWQY